MVVASRKELVGLSKDELWFVALDNNNDHGIQDEALQRWMAMDDHDYDDSIQRLRSLLDLMRRSKFGLSDDSADNSTNTSKVA
jgi:hypothetical protein